MKVTEGINWIMISTSDFEQTVSFFRNTMGLSVTAEGVPVTDTQFTRYAQIQTPGGAMLEVVEPNEAVRHLYNAPILSLTVDDLAQSQRELENMQIEFLSPIFDSKEGWGWAYFRVPDGNIYQLQGAYTEGDTGDDSDLPI
ncbi:MAG TPA: VOC family protein [Phototrophicaceae bacterium]|jgi:predicted enzyme related to lactoylglutathione lyase|nr:VOC family protein [Phototrophicaceae bacterium]